MFLENRSSIPEQKEAIPVQQSCRVLAVSRSAYYAAQRRAVKPSVCKASVQIKAAAG
ncbi:hypothetical protein GJA_5202 [Janthinobacterium agaricidamnosum NBRC 102515 = DSM 9628]|uniref:Uncharacterized protein n=1 Tax=Janthinobacterium agaricidamnosum NBRC 102515 = DSM 9628 TaxID=1349767 RepID=W0VAF5_9BURK|nr:hypothetical protein GJA_5202 [Janthinobacterium agaricidamnosum NBRC 102515 = DSM 9628]